MRYIKAPFAQNRMTMSLVLGQKPRRRAGSLDSLWPIHLIYQNVVTRGSLPRFLHIARKVVCIRFPAPLCLMEQSHVGYIGHGVLDGM